jgi:TolA-binding protein
MKLRFILFVSVLIGSAALFAADAPPPPSFNPDGGTPIGGDPNHPEDKGELPSGPAGGGSAEVAAPQISEEQMIRNSLEVSYQLYHAEDYEACEKSTAAILDKYPKRKLYWVRYLDALCLEHQDLYDAAIDQFARVKKEAPRSTYAHAAAFRIGLCEIKAHRPGDAIYTLREIIDNDPRSQYRMQAYVHLGNLYRGQRDWKSAQKIYRDLMRLFPETSWAHTSMLYLAESFSYQGKPDKAIKVYEEMQHTTSVPMQYKAQAQLRIGELYMAQKQWEPAIAAFRAALRDYGDIPGLSITADEKIALAQEGRRSGSAPYRSGKNGPRVVNQAPEDESFRLKQQKEAVPY